MRSSLHLYDTLSRQIRPFEPAGEAVSLYVCGVTPYDTTHLGHAFTYVAFDVLIRYLHFLGYAVRYVQNVTDIDDPLFERARELGVPYQELAADQTARYFDDMRALNVLPADLYPHASKEIPGMIELVEQLLRAGHAYQVDGHVYFSVKTDPTYGELSRLSREEMIEIARERGGNPDDPLRYDPLDFVLWRSAGDGEPKASSPWGEGLPGWHLECSTMSLKHLGAPIDIHGGGSDLIFPHHESEIAQSEGATGIQPFARFWVHTAMVYLGGEKMSKSLGNMVFVRDLVPRYGADAVRLYLLRCHYRSELHYDEAALGEAAEVANDLAAAAALPSGSHPPTLDLGPYRDRFVQRLSADLDTPGAVAVLQELASAIRQQGAEGRNAAPAQQLLRELGGVLGLRLEAREPIQPERSASARPAPDQSRSSGCS